jgi:hypothetical protein
MSSYAVVPIEEIDLDNHSTQPRLKICDEAVFRYYEMWAAHGDADGSPFEEDIVLVFDESDPSGKYLIASGWQRTLAAIQAGRTDIPARIEYGTLQDAILLAANQNHRHGVPSTMDDRRRAVRMVLEVVPHWTTNKIAKHCSVSTALVQKIRDGQGIESPAQVPGFTEAVKDDKPAKEPKPRKPREVHEAPPEDEREVVMGKEARMFDQSKIPLAKIQTNDALIDADFKHLVNLIDIRLDQTGPMGKAHIEHHDCIISLLRQAYSNFHSWRNHTKGIN